MVIEIEIKHTTVIVEERKGCYRRMLFAEMDEERARRLATEYGYADDAIADISHEALHYRHEVADELVLEVLERMPYRENHTPEQMLAAVRCIVPQATRIISY